jgi:hypothetical protein
MVVPRPAQKPKLDDSDAQRQRQSMAGRPAPSAQSAARPLPAYKPLKHSAMRWGSCTAQGPGVQNHAKWVRPTQNYKPQAVLILGNAATSNGKMIDKFGIKMAKWFALQNKKENSRFFLIAALTWLICLSRNE